MAYPLFVIRSNPGLCHCEAAVLPTAALYRPESIRRLWSLPSRVLLRPGRPVAGSSRHLKNSTNPAPAKSSKFTGRTSESMSVFFINTRVKMDKIVHNSAQSIKWTKISLLNLFAALLVWMRLTESSSCQKKYTETCTKSLYYKLINLLEKNDAFVAEDTWYKWV